jgi:hypothetical protein
MYIILTMRKYVDEKDLIPREQKGFYGGSKGCKGNLRISKTARGRICERHSYSVGKFLSVIHSWIIQFLDFVGSVIIAKKIMD